MKFTAKCYPIKAEKPIVIMNEADAKFLGVYVSGRVSLSYRGKEVTAIVNTTKSFVDEHEIGLYKDVTDTLKVRAGDKIMLKPTERPKSVEFIKKKIDGYTLNYEEIYSIIKDVVDDNLSSIELTAFVTGGYMAGYNLDEIVSLTQAIVKTGRQIDFGDDIVDKHCIGGVAGNRTTMLIVPIVAAAGATIPKTSSRAITSPAGTADTMEVLAPVDFGVEELQRIIRKINACISWGGAVNLAPADDKIIQVEYPLSLDAEGHVLSSVMAKKISVGSDYILIDIPVGVGSKVPNPEKADEMKHNFIELGKRLGVAVDCVITNGSSPIGNGIGPALEARDVLLSLENNGSVSLVKKSVMLAGNLLELAGKAKKGTGRRIAKRILDSGKAKAKMMEIIEEQGGNPEIKPDDIKIGKKEETIKSDVGGRLKFINNKEISAIARAAGAPRDKTSGLYLHINPGDFVDKGDALFTIYSSKNRRLNNAMELADTLKPVKYV
ncbi:MAG: AMP phosphorylase [Candidatus Altiarchaeales archaeon]|nr:AMP phosphorylase [Candidatus Altiarchaeales archaeon]